MTALVLATPYIIYINIVRQFTSIQNQWTISKEKPYEHGFAQTYTHTKSIDTPHQNIEIHVCLLLTHNI